MIDLVSLVIPSLTGLFHISFYGEVLIGGMVLCFISVILSYFFGGEF